MTLGELSVGPLVTDDARERATTAMANDLPVFTCNPGDYGGVEGLEVVVVEAGHHV